MNNTLPPTQQNNSALIFNNIRFTIGSAVAGGFFAFIAFTTHASFWTAALTVALIGAFAFCLSWLHGEIKPKPGIYMWATYIFSFWIFNSVILPSLNH